MSIAEKKDIIRVHFVVASIFLYKYVYVIFFIWLAKKKENRMNRDIIKSGWMGLLKTKAIILQSQ